jgi:hypothetical protein
VTASRPAAVEPRTTRAVEGLGRPTPELIGPGGTGARRRGGLPNNDAKGKGGSRMAKKAAKKKATKKTAKKR